MKKILSLILAAAMIVAVLAMVGCGGDTDTTTEAPVVDTTTEAPAATTTEASATTTEASATTTEASATTTEASATTTEASATTTEAPIVDTTTTTPTTATTIASGTTVPMLARFDFGTKTKAEAEGLTSHEYLTSILTYDASRVAIEYTEDTWVIYAKKDYVSGDAATAFALCFEDIVTYDFEAEFIPGYGSWNGAPISSASVGKNWQGKLQYMQIRILNSTTNNMISVRWHRAGEGYSTRTLNTCMYLQGGIPGSAGASDSAAKTAKNVSTEWTTYTYDMVFLAAIGREFTVDGACESYLEGISDANERGGYAGNNWNTANGNITALQFNLLGAYGSGDTSTIQYKVGDSRTNIKMGNKVEVDYIIFGSSVEQLNAYTSYLEDSAKA